MQRQGRELALTVKKRVADTLLQRLNAATERRLRQADRLRRAIKTAIFNQRDKVAQLAKIEMHRSASLSVYIQSQYWKAAVQRNAGHPASSMPKLTIRARPSSFAR